MVPLPRQISTIIKDIRDNEFISGGGEGREYNSYTLFLIPSHEWLKKEKEEQLNNLYENYRRFGEAIGNNNGAFWFYNNERVSNVNIIRCKDYCDRFKLNYNNGPYVLILDNNPDTEKQIADFKLIKLANINTDRIIKVLNVLEWEIRNKRSQDKISGRALIYEEYKQIFLSAVDRSHDILKDVIIELVKDGIEVIIKAGV